MSLADFITAKEVPSSYSTSSRTLDRAGVPHYRLTSKGKRLYKRSEIEAALTRHVSTVGMEKQQLDVIVNSTVDEVLQDLGL
jgi:hypothetical protein